MSKLLPTQLWTPYQWGGLWIHLWDMPKKLRFSFPTFCGWPKHITVVHKTENWAQDKKAQVLGLYIPIWALGASSSQPWSVKLGMDQAPSDSHVLILYFWSGKLREYDYMWLENFMKISNIPSLKPHVLFNPLLTVILPLLLFSPTPKMICALFPHISCRHLAS